MELSEPDWENNVFFSRVEGNGVGTVITFAEAGLNYCEDPYVVSARTKTTARSVDYKTISKRIQDEFLSGFRGSFSIQQMNAAWFGRATLPEFLYLLSHPTERYHHTPEDFSLDPHHSASAVFITDSDSFIKNIAIHARPSSYDGSIDNIGISFLYDGVPIHNNRVRDALDETFLRVEPARPIDCRSQQFPGGDLWPEKEIAPQSDSVRGLICENPFFQDEQLARERLDPYLDAVAKDHRWYAHIGTSPDINWNDTYYEIRRFLVTDLSPFVRTHSFDVMNVYLQCDYRRQHDE